MFCRRQLLCSLKASNVAFSPKLKRPVKLTFLSNWKPEPAYKASVSSRDEQRPHFPHNLAVAPRWPAHANGPAFADTSGPACVWIMLLRPEASILAEVWTLNSLRKPNPLAETCSLFCMAQTFAKTISLPRAAPLLRPLFKNSKACTLWTEYPICFNEASPKFTFPLKARKKPQLLLLCSGLPHFIHCLFFKLINSCSRCWGVLIGSVNSISLVCLSSELTWK